MQTTRIDPTPTHRPEHDEEHGRKGCEVDAGLPRKEREAEDEEDLRSRATRAVTHAAGARDPCGRSCRTVPPTARMTASELE